MDSQQNLLRRGWSSLATTNLRRRRSFPSIFSFFFFFFHSLKVLKLLGFMWNPFSWGLFTCVVLSNIRKERGGRGRERGSPIKLKAVESKNYQG